MPALVCTRGVGPADRGSGRALRFAPRYWMLYIFGAAPASFSEWWHRG